MINNAAIFPGQGNLDLEKFKKIIEENLEAQRILDKAILQRIFKRVHIIRKF